MTKLYTYEHRIFIFNLKNFIEGDGIESIVMNEYVFCYQAAFDI